MVGIEGGLDNAGVALLAEEHARDDYTYQSSSRVLFHFLSEAQLSRERKHMTLEVVSSQRQEMYVNSVKHGTPA